MKIFYEGICEDFNKRIINIYKQKTTNMEQPWGYYCLNKQTGRHFAISAIALKTARKDAAWEKIHLIKHPIDINGNKLKTDEEIGSENEAIKKAFEEQNQAKEVKQPKTKKAE